MTSIGPIAPSLPWLLIKEYVRTRLPGTVNKPAVQFINTDLLNRGFDAAAILDNRTLDYGSHHQKVIIVGVRGKLIAYVGGIEVNRDRLPPPMPPDVEPGTFPVV
jgi:hypothetical protein